jgi:NADPH:quinone reductase
MPRRGSLNLVAPGQDSSVRAALVDPTERRLVLADVDPPTAGPEQLLVAVRAAGLNRADLAVIAGTYQASAAPAPFVAGAELAGEVVSVGDAVSGWSIGDRVMAMGRGYAELAVVDAALAAPVPPLLGWAQAGALPVAVATMHDALVTNGGLRAGHHVVVNAATSGVGVVAVRIALHLGAARVIGTSRADEKRRQLSAIIADDRFTIVAPDELVETADAITAGHGVDVIVDNVGATTVAPNIALAAIGGRIVQVGRLGGRHDTIDLDELARKRIALVGVTFRTRTAAERAAVVRAAWTALADGIAGGDITPVVHAEHQLEDVEVALGALRADGHVGKLVITP